MSKYSTLPGLDTQPDVYETPDPTDAPDFTAAAPRFPYSLYGNEVDEDDEETVGSDTRDEGIVRPHFSSVAAASERFGGAAAGGEGPDFSGKLRPTRRPHMRRGGQRAAQDSEGPVEYSLGPFTGSDAKGRNETKVERLRRLMFEVEDLGRELQNDTTKDRPETDKDNGVDSSEAGVGGTATKPRSAKRKGPSHAQLLEVVSTLQSDLSGIGKLMAASDYALDGDVDVSDAHSARPTPAKRLEQGQNLLNQIRALKNVTLSEEMSNATKSSPVPLSNAVASAASAATALTTTSEPYLTYELFYTPETAKLNELAKVTELESRLASLERLIGTHFLDGLEGDNAAVTSLLHQTGSLIGALHRLDNHLAVLTQPRQLDLVANRVKVITADMEKLADLKKKQQLEASVLQSMFSHNAHTSLTGSSSYLPTTSGAAAHTSSADDDLHMSKTQTETERRINHLFNLLNKLDPVAGLLPHLVARLRGLKALHNEAAVFSDSLKMLQGEQARVAEGYKNMDEAIERLQESLSANETAVEKNVEALQGRLEGLAERVDRLVAKAK
ncbi:Dynamitin-domain-containing protein [Fimicolochytrium jonesii]|uniref:Dynamitin-domain-containing protein n=1 Tax=Fimicolochytrium jonesii TaxID=1396493 RepID=UPI0022FDC02F|nr:Dynamitin-domain-containing protein [Fimicolochytrium jonesii]KAI8819908.1 Dynamitin-domain-containing protein [Fimicolochytrium jonesii]